MPVSISEIMSQIGEGRTISSTSNSENTSSFPTFTRMVVLDVISDPNITLLDKNKKSEWEKLGITNMGYVDILPRNTIIAKKIGEENLPMFLFPFFPSHLALPCKAGESIWAMFENQTSTENSTAFWFCKITESRLSDDVNHSHPGSVFETSHYQGSKSIVENSPFSQNGEDVWYELRNGPVKIIDGERKTSQDASILKGEPDDIFEKLITETDASKIFTYEAVPRFCKRPGDVALEGTNNTLIVLGSDRKDELKKTSFNSSSGMIDIVSGRGQTKETYGTSADTTRIKAGKSKGEKIKSELNKSPSVLEKNEGNPDFKNDRSRILVSQRTSVDKNFELDAYNKEKFSVEDDTDGDAAIVIKSDKIRLIARSDVEIIVKGFDDSKKSPAGQKRKDENEKSDKWASIVIKANGDIVMRPADKGYIKLGGDDANLAVLCEEATKLNGTVTCPAGITDTMGGIQGLAPEGGSGQGTFAKKVLLK